MREGSVPSHITQEKVKGKKLLEQNEMNI